MLTDAEGRLRAMDWADHIGRMKQLLAAQYEGRAVLKGGTAPRSMRRAIEAYFAGELSVLDTIPCETAGTAFQRQVWRALRNIPAGTTLSYAKLAQRIGRATAIRAVGAANGANPISVIIPCHRMIGSDGSLTGYGGGLPRKRWLLEHEGVHL